ncbi:hypothetical protein EXIGLDRAFT_784222 [Exidia glandulosa HHB12029]|uniref:Uncharacterized protein n=1 Tax=Exidia glandulosa HHB12029 TaxID=1314781 RepID=A0A166MLF1_EXIGL|nr:hypothetical protein EXIGLDRAFT_784222 [Exidia glandulosa HHB12029]
MQPDELRELARRIPRITVWNIPLELEASVLHLFCDRNRARLLLQYTNKEYLSDYDREALYVQYTRPSTISRFAVFEYLDGPVHLYITQSDSIVALRGIGQGGKELEVRCSGSVAELSRALSTTLSATVTALTLDSRTLSVLSICRNIWSTFTSLTILLSDDGSLSIFPPTLKAFGSTSAITRLCLESPASSPRVRLSGSDLMPLLVDLDGPVKVLDLRRVDITGCAIADLAETVICDGRRVLDA